MNEVPRVISALRKVQELRNSVIAVEHSPLVVESADHVIELGPGAGPNGGHLVYEGPPIARTATSSIAVRESKPGTNAKSKSAPTITLAKIDHHNLPKLEVEFLSARLNVVAGPSGCGKTTLLTQVLFPSICQRLGPAFAAGLSPAGTCELSGGEHLIEAVLIDQSPLTKSAPVIPPRGWRSSTKFGKHLRPLWMQSSEDSRLRILVLTRSAAVAVAVVREPACSSKTCSFCLISLSFVPNVTEPDFVEKFLK